jgi:hypothetical protein
MTTLRGTIRETIVSVVIQKRTLRQLGLVSVSRQTGSRRLVSSRKRLSVLNSGWRARKRAPRHATGLPPPGTVVLRNQGDQLTRKCHLIVVPASPSDCEAARKSAGKLRTGLDTLLRDAICSAVSVRSSALRFASSCSSVRAPITADRTPDWAFSHATSIVTRIGVALRCNLADHIDDVVLLPL